MASHQEYLSIIRRIPSGKVATYQDVASLAGSPRGAVSVGDALKKYKHLPGLPWWRVVAAGGRLSLGAPDEQGQLLAVEGVRCDIGRVDLSRYRWDGLPDQ